jgi:type I restriction enzyme S subunit
MLRPYEKYKKTKAAWIDSIPFHWESRKVRELFIERKTKVSDKDYAPLSVSKAGIVPQLDTAVKTDNGDNRKLVKVGDFVINSRSDRKGSSGVSPLNGSVSLINIVLKPITNENLRYLHYLLKCVPFTEEYYRNGRGLVADLWTTRYTELKNIFLPIPPREEQDQIVQFLDWKTSETSHFIHEKKREIRRLQELKISIINKAVTKGLTENVEMKDTGIKWLPQIPAHWKISYLRQFLFAVSEKNHPDMPLLSVTRENGVILRDIDDYESNHNFIPDDLSGYKFVRKGQFVINKMKAWQGSYGVSEYDGIVSPAYFVFNLKFENKEFFHFAIRSRIYVNFFAQFSDGIRTGQWDLSMQKLKHIPFFVPPAEEQAEILKVVPSQIAAIDKMIAALKDEISYVAELRTKIIADVVTGKVDVSNVLIPKFEETTDDDIDVNIDEDTNNEEYGDDFFNEEVDD